MNALVLTAVGHVEMRRMPDPRPHRPTDVVVSVEAAGLCGSDLHPYLGREDAAFGVVAGHEAVGIVAEAGPDVPSELVGRRVVVPFTTSCGACEPCRLGLTARCTSGAVFGWGDPTDPGRLLHGCQAEAVRVPFGATTVVPIPESVSPELGVLLCDNLPTAAYALQRTELEAGSLAVVGLGSVGLCAVWLALRRGLDVVGVDPVESRRAVAAAFGASVADPADAHALGVDASIEASGAAEGQRLAAAIVRPGGTVSVIAVQTAAAIAVGAVEAYDTNLTLRFGRAPVRAILDDLLPSVVDGRLSIPVEALVTHPGRHLEEGPDLYRRFAEREEGLIKAVFEPRADT